MQIGVGLEWVRSTHNYISCAKLYLIIIYAVIGLPLMEGRVWEARVQYSPPNTYSSMTCDKHSSNFGVQGI